MIAFRAPREGSSRGDGGSEMPSLSWGLGLCEANIRQVRGQHPRDDQKGQGALLGAKPPVWETQVTRKDIIVGSHTCLGVAQAPELPWVLRPSSVSGGLVPADQGRSLSVPGCWPVGPLPLHKCLGLPPLTLGPEAASLPPSRRHFPPAAASAQWLQKALVRKDLGRGRANGVLTALGVPLSWPSWDSSTWLGAWHTAGAP